MMTPTAVDELLRSLGVTQGHLAREGVLDERTVRRLRLGLPVRPSSIRRLAQALGVPVDVVERGAALAAEERALAPTRGRE